MKYAVVALTRGGSRLAERIARLEECDVYLFASRDGVSSLVSVHTFTSLSQLYPLILPRYRVVVMIMALGIVIRTIAPHLRGKDVDPAVLVLDEKGKFVISALSGHLGGANEIAQDLANKLGAVAVITTSTDVQGTTAVDSLARKLGWQVEPVAGLKRVNGAMANGEQVVFASDCDYLVGREFYGHEVVPVTKREKGRGHAPLVIISNRERDRDGSYLYLRPKNLYLGVGCRRGVGVTQLLAAVHQTFDKYQLSVKSLREVTSCTVKEKEAGLQELAHHLGVPVRFYSPRELEETVRKYHLTGSSFVKTKIGVEAVCEPAAMRGAAAPRMTVTKQVFPGVTVAVAEDTSLWWA